MSEATDLLGRNARHLGHDRLDLLDVDQLLALALGQQALAGTGLVDHVDRLVRQQAVTDVLDRQVDRGLQRIIGVGDAVVRLVTRLEALQDLEVSPTVGSTMSIFWKRRASARSFSKMPRYSWNVVEPMQRSSPDASAGLIRLEASMVPPRRRAGTDDGVDLVDEQDRVGHLLQRGQHALEALLEVAAVLGARHQRAQVERVDDRIGQHVRHLAFDDAPGQAFGDGGLAHAGLAHVERVVLAAAAQDLDGALDFVGAAHQRVDLAVAAPLVEVAGELGQGIALGLALAALGRPSPRPPAALRRPRPAWRCRGTGN